jgi:hypothetical protein
VSDWQHILAELREQLDLNHEPGQQNEYDEGFDNWSIFETEGEGVDETATPGDGDE